MLILCDFVLKVRIICSAQTKPQYLFETSPVSKGSVEDQRALMDDLGITEVILVVIIIFITQLV